MPLSLLVLVAEAHVEAVIGSSSALVFEPVPLAAQCALWGRLSMDQRLALATAWKLNMAQANEWFRSSSKGSSSKVTSQEPSDHSIDKSWQKNLVADGDVEPNPGPSSWRGLTLNCGFTRFNLELCEIGLQSPVGCRCRLPCRRPFWTLVR